MLSNVFRSSHVRLNRPNRVLRANVSSIDDHAMWPFNAGDDPWADGSTSPRYYQWRITLSVISEQHGSHLTRDDYEYNGLDVVVGDWIAGANDGKCLKVVSIESKTKDSVTCIVEDWLRYNTFKSPAGNGIFNIGPVVIFTLNEYGFPMFDPMPATVSSTFFPVVYSRFQYLNPRTHYVMKQEGHSLSRGDVVSVTNNGFVPSSPLTLDHTVGLVIDNGPGPDYFILSPNNQIVDFYDGVPGEQGDYIYVTADGELTDNVQVSATIGYLNIQSAIPTVLTGLPDPVINIDYSITINGAGIPLANGSNVDSIALAINSNPDHDVTADVVPVETSITSNSTGTRYGQVGGYSPFSAYFDTGSGNTEVIFTTSGLTYPGVSGIHDMAYDINSANITNLTANVVNNNLVITESMGNAIVITNGNADVNGAPFVGASNVSGLPATTPATNQSKLSLTRNNGGEILIYEPSDIFATVVGITSGHTGQLAMAIDYQEGVYTTGGTIVVPDIANLPPGPQAGQTAYVINKGDGEWGLYLYDGAGWVQISNADSATTDAKTLVTTFEMPIAGNTSTTVHNLGNISVGRKVTAVNIDVEDAVTGGTLTPTITVGVTGDASLLMDSSYTDLVEETNFVTIPDFVHSSGADDLTINATLNHYGATSGNVIVRVTYV